MKKIKMKTTVKCRFARGKNMKPKIVLCGATGYTGRLAAEALVHRALRNKRADCIFAKKSGRAGLPAIGLGGSRWSVAVR
jgi:hypothetical protein